MARGNAIDNKATSTGCHAGQHRWDVVVGADGRDEKLCADCRTPLPTRHSGLLVLPIRKPENDSACAANGHTWRRWHTDSTDLYSYCVSCGLTAPRHVLDTDRLTRETVKYDSVSGEERVRFSPRDAAGALGVS
jgi:hypothetical protein